MSQSQALAVQNGQALQHQTKQSNELASIREYASIFYHSGMFTDIKSEAQAAVKILAGRAFGFDEITSMAYVHLIQNKATLGAKLQAALIKASGRYNYKVTEHTDKACTVQFTQLFDGKWTSLGLPIRYTIEEAVTAGVTTNPTWKKHPKAMLFASCIRQGMTRYTPDLLRTGGNAPNYSEISNAIEDVSELAELTTTDEAKAEPIEAEIVTSAPADPSESHRADLETLAFDLIQQITNGEPAEVKKLLKGKQIANVTDDELKSLIADWQSI